MGVGAGDKGIQALDPVRESVGRKEVERTIRHRRLCREAIFAKYFQNVVGTHGAMPLQEDFEDALARGRQLQAVACATLRHHTHGIRNALVMIVVGKADSLHLGLI